MIQILHRYTQAVLYSGDHSTLAETVTAAIRSRVNLTWADLSRANLSRADLTGANLSRANLSRADLTGANLFRANLTGADLTGANGVEYSQVSFHGHGECRRMLTLTRINNELRFFCGCFQGTPEELKTYIENGEERYRASRTFAMNFCLEAIKFPKA